MLHLGEFLDSGYTIFVETLAARNTGGIQNQLYCSCSLLRLSLRTSMHIDVQKGLMVRNGTILKPEEALQSGTRRGSPLRCKVSI